jgi:hypothetical protein
MDSMDWVDVVDRLAVAGVVIPAHAGIQETT